MSQIGLKALKVLGGAEAPTDNTAQLSEAWLNKIKKINIYSKMNIITKYRCNKNNKINKAKINPKI